MARLKKEVAGKVAPKEGWLPLTAWSIITLLIGFMISKYIYTSEDESVLSILNEEQRALMIKYDKDENFHLDVREVKSLLKEMLDSENTVEDQQRENIEDEFLNITVSFTPIILGSMSQKQKDVMFGTEEYKYNPCFDGLLRWMKPNVEEQTFPAKMFSVFTPERNAKIGKVYWLFDQVEIANDLSNSRYRPPSPRNSAEKVISSILSMFHPNVFTTMRFTPRGTAAVVRSVSEIYIEVCFRIHAEYQLNTKPLLPFWFTPGRFEGYVIMAKDSSHVREFVLELPTNISLNVDMEWIWLSEEDNSENVEVDIGFVPKMRLTSRSPSAPIILQHGDDTLDRRELWKSGKDVEFRYDEINWTDKISRGEARKLLERAFYPFMEVEYYSLSEAFTEAQKRNKPVHQIVLWGALNDQSC